LKNYLCPSSPAGSPYQVACRKGTIHQRRVFRYGKVGGWGDEKNREIRYIYKQYCPVKVLKRF